MDAIDHLDLVVSDVERSLRFYSALGLHHIAFNAPDRETVDERARWAADYGATIESEPREYDYSPGYYAVFLHDPDGLKLEVVWAPRQS